MDANKSNLQIKKELPRGLLIASFLAIFFVLALLPFIAWLLEYKDAISAPLTITTKVTPVDIYAKSAGELVLRIDNNALVEKGETLAYIKNTAEYEEVELLKEKLYQTNKADLAIAKELCSTSHLKVGEIKPALIALIKAVENHQTFIKTDQHTALINSRLEQIKHYEDRQVILKEKANYIADNKAFLEKFAEADKKLFESDALSEREADKSSQAKIATVIAELDNKTIINDLAIEIATLKRENKTIQSQFEQQQLTFVNAIKDTLQLLKTSLEAWELNYLLTANISGICVFKDYLNNFRYVETEEKIFSLVPQGTAQYFALLQLPIQGAGKVKEGQEVYVKLNNYPFMEFGVLKGEVANISALPFDNHYNVHVNFPKGFVSTYGDTLLTQPLMHGVGEVIVERKSLYNRIADQVKSVRLNR